MKTWICCVIGALMCQSVTAAATAAPLFVKSSSWPGFQRGICMSVARMGDTLFVAAGDAGLMTFDLSNEAAPRRLGSVEFIGTVEAVVVEGEYAYVASSNTGLWVVNATNRAAPDTYASNPQRIQTLAAAGGYIVGADRSSGTYIFAMDGPGWLRQIAYHPGTPNAVAVVGNYAYIADATAGLEILDISDRAKPIKVGGIPGEASGVSAAGNYVFFAASFMLNLVDVSNPAAPNVLSSVPINTASGNVSIVGTARVAVEGTTAFLSGWLHGLEILDISDPTNMRRIAKRDHGGLTVDVTVKEGVAVVLDRDAGFELLDVSKPSEPVALGKFEMHALALRVAVSGKHAFVGEMWRGVQVVDISDPAQPRRVGEYRPPFEEGLLSDLKVVGSRAYAVFMYSGLHILDIADPVNPKEIGRMTLPGEALFVDGPYAYVLCGPSGLKIIDVSNPSAPMEVGRISDFTGAALVVSNNYAYITEPVPLSFPVPSGSLRVVDVSDPRRPTTVAVKQLGTREGIAIYGNHIYAGGAGGDIIAVDISDPSAPRVTGYCTTSQSRSSNVQVFGSYAYVSSERGAVAVVDISDPAAMKRVLGYSVPGGARGVDVTEKGMFVAAFDWGMAIHEKGPVLRISKENSEVRLRFFGPAGSQFSIERSGNILNADGWEPVETNTAAEQGNSYVETGVMQRDGFYRARILQ